MSSAVDCCIDEWVQSVHSLVSKDGESKNKLRLYQKFKFDYEHEQYVNMELDTLLGAFGLTEPSSTNSTQSHLCRANDTHEDSEDEIETTDNIDTHVSRYLSQESETYQVDSENDDPQFDLDKLDSVYDKGCGCSKNCFLQFSVEEIRSNIYNLRELTKTEKELLIMGTLKKIGNDQRCRSGERKRVRYEYIFNGIKICQDAFLVIYDIGLWTVRALLKHMKEKGVQPRVHGNFGRKAPNAFSHETIKDAVQFLLNYASEEGLPQPAAPRGRGEKAPVYLPSKNTKQSIHQEYVTACSQIEKQYVGLSTFKDLWKRCVPHIKIAAPKDDVCKTCEDFRQDIQLARTEDEKLSATEKYHNHVLQARKEREIYRECVERSTNMFERLRRQDERSGDNFSCNDVHYTFDFSQYVKLPHHTREKGPTYFIQPRKIQIFGYRVDGDKQYNFLIDENETIGRDGQLVHGPDAVISMLDHAFANYSLGENECSLHADNCFGQNKNRYVLGYLSWRIMTQRHQKITYMMQLPGHTRCLIDAGFGNIKTLYRRKDCDTLQHIAEVVSNSSHSNQPVTYDGGSGWVWRAWKTFIGDRFKKVPNVAKYHFFRFSSEEPGVVYMRQSAVDENEVRFVICKTHLLEMARDDVPSQIVPPGLSAERVRYLYRHVRPLVRRPFQDVLCPAPEES
ncbi:uncharacterized protein LOC128552653 [Mercenaria mercenaria]|uniref:uncharacterized protein LOC128552653 n=1 Tax=Mercenaria mercenaria TaxID=6596 RepID=UPI00234E9555|nr:uncharacterized protein LOC128552653 [Mercenaria mercenaria]